MKLVRISNDKIQIKSNDAEFQNVKINDLLKVSDGIVNLIAIVEQLTDTNADFSIQQDDFIGDSVSLKSIDCAIIGSLKNGLFVQAIDKYPTTNVFVEPVTDEVFSSMLGKYECNGFKLGAYASYECNAYIDGNKLFQRHACILGNTGSGKSETVAKVLEEVSNLKGANVIVFDIHGEYSGLSYARTIKIGEAFPFPIWMFGLNDIATNILKIKEETATTVMTALRKSYYKVCQNGNEGKPHYFDYENFVAYIDYLNTQEVPTGEFYKTGDKAGMAKTTKGDYNGKLSSTINSLNDKQLDKRFKFLFSNMPQDYVYDFMKLVLKNDKPVKNIDLSGIPHDLAIAVIGVITKLIYGIQLLKKEISPITLVCDEAHVYIPNNFQLSPSERRMVEIFEDIAKEGRKFGITLLPATQRPSELNKTILAQCANFIVMKLNNENDKSMIKGMLPDGNDSIIDAVTMFNPGECLVIGDSAPIPLKIKVDLAKERPQSRTIDFWDEWKKQSEIDVNSLMDEYMQG